MLFRRKSPIMAPSRGEPMKYRKWDPKTKMQIILESLEGKMPLAELCNKYQIRQSMYYYWLKELRAKGYKVFESEKQMKKEQKLIAALLTDMRRGEILNLIDGEI
jgi:transposase-like protein